MTKEELIRMALNAEAWQHVYDANPPMYGPLIFDDAALERFAALVAAAEREACAHKANIALLGADRGLANRVNQAIRNRT